MTTNVGNIDRLLRAVVGLVLLYLAFLGGMAAFEGTMIKYAAAAVGAILLLTSAFKLCPIYSILGIKTCKDN